MDYISKSLAKLYCMPVLGQGLCKQMMNMIDFKNSPSCPHAVTTLKWKKNKVLRTSCCGLPSWLSVANFAVLCCTDQWAPGGLNYHGSECSEGQMLFLLPLSVWSKISRAEEWLNSSFCVCLTVDSSDQSCEIKSKGNLWTHQGSNKTVTVGAEYMAQSQTK